MDATPSSPASSDLSQYGALIRRRWWVVAASAMVGLVIGGLLLVAQPKVYTSSVQVLVKDGTPNGNQQSLGGKTKTISLDTEAAIMKSSAVALKAKEQLKSSESPDELRKRIQVDAVPNSSVLAVLYNAQSPEAAQQGAQGYAQGYLNYRLEQFKQENAAQVNALKSQLVTLSKQQRDLVQSMFKLAAGSTERSIRQAQLNGINRQITSAGEKIAVLEGQAVDPGNIISDAQPGKQTSPILALYLGSGLMIGLLVGVILALWRDRADRRIRRAEDIERLLNLPVLLNVPAKGKSPIGLLPARSQGGQAFHELAHSLTATLGHGHHVVLVAGVTPGLGSSAICANLAAALARTESDVVLVCANLPSAYTARLLGLEDGPGLAEILVHGAKVSTVVQTPPELPRMRVITPGNDEDLAWERLQTQSMDRLVAGLRRHATYVIIETPPTSTSADAQSLADLADASVIVAEVPRARHEDVRESIRQLDRMGSAVLGAVVLPVQPGTPTTSQPTPRARRHERRERPALADAHPSGGNGNRERGRYRTERSRPRESNDAQYRPTTGQSGTGKSSAEGADDIRDGHRPLPATNADAHRLTTDAFPAISSPDDDAIADVNHFGEY